MNSLLIDFKKDWINNHISEFLEKQLKIPVLFIYIAGSSLLDLRTTNSDIDILLFTSKKIHSFRLPYKFKYNNITVHGWCNSIYNNLKVVEDIFGWGAIEDCYVKEDSLLYINPKYQEYFNFFFNTKEQSSYLHWFLSIEKEREYFYFFLNNDFIYFKSFYAILYWYKTHIDNTISIELIKQYKTGKLLPQEKEKIIQYGKKIWEYHLNIDIKEILKFIDTKNKFLQNLEKSLA